MRPVKKIIFAKSTQMIARLGERACRRLCSRSFSSSPLVVRSLDAATGVVTLRMNAPRKLNSWSPAMISAMSEAFGNAAGDDSVRAAVYTGTGK